MKICLLAFAFLIVIVTTSFGQSATTVNPFKWLTGQWVGEGSGKPGEGKGEFTLKEDLSGNILVRKAHTEYPATSNRLAFSHDDLMIIYKESGLPSKAIYFDNEGHTINYGISFNDGVITFTSIKTGSAPLFRLTYKKLDENRVEIKFEISTDGITFNAYTTGICKKISNE